MYQNDTKKRAVKEWKNIQEKLRKAAEILDTIPSQCPVCEDGHSCIVCREQLFGYYSWYLAIPNYFIGLLQSDIDRIENLMPLAE